MSERRFPWRTLLFLSLALNLLIVGAVAGAIGAGVRVARGAPGAAVDRMPGARAFLDALPPETRVKMRREMVESWAETRDLRLAALEARREAFVAMSAEPYDAARVRAAFVRLRAADQAVVGVFHDNVVEAFGELTPEERREALEALRAATPGDDAEAVDAADPESADERRRARRERWRARREGNP